MKILVIDDQPDILRHMRKVLQTLGHACDTFENPLVALNHFNKDQYDVVISDIVMPEMNGYAVAAEVRRIAGEARIILVSGQLTEAMENTTGDSDSVVYMGKPVDVHRLKTVLDTMDRQSWAAP